MLINCDGKRTVAVKPQEITPCCVLANNTLTVGLSVAVLYLFEEDVVHDDHGRQVGVGAPHHRQLGGLRTLLHLPAGRVLGVCGVHGAHVFGACICRPQTDTTYNNYIIYYYNITPVIKSLHWLPVSQRIDF